jgi:D-sedoheptulose 7-phosphate isomerase
MLVHRVQQQFIDSADLTYQCADALGASVDAAIGALLATVTGGGKVVACGLGSGGVLAQLLVAHLVNGLERERPALPALLLPDAGAPDAVLRQLGALAAADDLLLLVGDTTEPERWLSLIRTAHERDMAVVALTGLGAGVVARVLRDTDVHVAVPHTRRTRVHEVHHLVLNCMCDGIDAHLLGDAADMENT